MKRCSSSATRELKIKITMRCHFLSAGMLIIKKTGSNNCWQGCGEITTLRLPAGTYNSAASFETVWQFLKTWNIEFPYDPSPLLGIYQRETKTYIQTKTCTHIFIVSIFIVAKVVSGPSVHHLMNGWMEYGTSIPWSIAQE